MAKIINVKLFNESTHSKLWNGVKKIFSMHFEEHGKLPKPITQNSKFKVEKRIVIAPGIYKAVLWSNPGQGDDEEDLGDCNLVIETRDDEPFGG
jgi:hypothetical protein